MSDFQLNNDVDKEKTFLVNLSEIEGRLDPLFYSSDVQKFNNGKYNSKPLNKVCLLFKSGFGAGKNDQSDEINGVIHIRPTNIGKEGNIKFDKNVYVPFDKKADTINNKSVLFNNTNSQELVGKTAYGSDAIGLYYSNHITKIEVDEKHIEAKYLQIVLNAYQRNNIFYSICTNWNNQSGVGIELLKSLKIPLPPKLIQQQIINKYESAYTQKQQKENKAKNLLASIDDYLLKELGISLPEKDNSLENRIFTTSVREIRGGRFDPIFYSDKIQFLQKSKYQYRNLRECVSGFNSGFGIGKNEQDKNGDGIIQIRPTNIDNNGNLKFEKNILVPFEMVSDNNKLVYGDVIFNNTNSQVLVGKTAIFLSEIPIATYSNHITILKAKENIAFSFYIKELLNLFQRHKFFYSICTNWNNQSGIGTELLKNIAIPLPILDKQKEIANHISEIRAKAKQLELDAQEVLDKAKQEVEQMILGAK